MSDKLEKKLADEFTRGYLVALGTLIGNRGSSTEAEEMFKEIGSPSAKEVRRLRMCQYDCKQLAIVRKAVGR